MAREIMTRVQRVFLRPDGIVQTVNLRPDTITLDDAREQVLAVARVGGGVRRPVFVDTTIATDTSTDARQHFASAETAQYVSAIAILYKGTFGRVIGNFMLARQSSDVPIRLFEHEADAIRWLRDYVPGASEDTAKIRRASLR